VGEKMENDLFVVNIMGEIESALAVDAMKERDRMCPLCSKCALVRGRGGEGGTLTPLAVNALGESVRPWERLGARAPQWS